MDGHLQQRQLRRLHSTHRKICQHRTHHLHLASRRPLGGHSDFDRNLGHGSHQECEFIAHRHWINLVGLYCSLSMMPKQHSLSKCEIATHQKSLDLARETPNH